MKVSKPVFMNSRNNKSTVKTILFSSVLLPIMLIQTIKADDALLTQYLQSKGSEIVVFDESNIKQFWIENTVASRKDDFTVVLSPQKEFYESDSYKIQFANVDETLDCIVEVISNSSGANFSVSNTNGVKIADSTNDENFLSYSITKATVHLEDTINSTFNVTFKSKTNESISIKKIIFSFVKNKNGSFSKSIQKNVLTEDNANIRDNTQSKVIVKSVDEENALYITGKRSVVSFKEMIPFNNRKIIASAKIKNTGNEETLILFGFTIFNQNRKKIDGRNYPYKVASKILKVVSTSEDGTTILVDSYDEYWTKGCRLGLNANEDMSDIPNSTLADGSIVECTKMDNGQAKIVLDKPLKDPLPEGTKIRIQGTSSDYIYAERIRLKPGEERLFSAIIPKDEKYYQYSSQAISNGVSYFSPTVLSYSSDSTKENTILIKDYTTIY